MMMNQQKAGQGTAGELGSKQGESVQHSGSQGTGGGSWVSKAADRKDR